MDNERLSTILKLVAGLGSAGVSAISPAAGRAVRGGTSMWANMEEHERAKKEATLDRAQRDRDAELREIEHDQTTRLNDLVIAQKTSQIAAERHAKKVADEMAASRKQRLASIVRPAGNVGPLTERDQRVIDEGPDVDTQVAALRGGGWSEYGNVLRDQQKQRTAVSQAQLDREATTQGNVAAMEKALAVAGVTAGSRERVAATRAENATKPGAVNEDDLAAAHRAVAAFENDPDVKAALAGVKTQEELDSRMQELVVTRSDMAALIRDYNGALDTISRYGNGQAGGDPKIVPPDKVDSFFKRNPNPNQKPKQ